MLLKPYLVAPLCQCACQNRDSLRLPKAFAIIQRSAARLRSAFASLGLPFTDLFVKLQCDLQRLAAKQKRRKSPSTLARILAAGL